MHLFHSRQTATVTSVTESQAAVQTAHYIIYRTQRTNFGTHTRFNMGVRLPYVHQIYHNAIN